MSNLAELESLRNVVAGKIKAARIEMVPAVVEYEYQPNVRTAAASAAAELKYSVLMRAYNHLAIKIVVLKTKMAAEAAVAAQRSIETVSGDPTAIMA